MGGFVTFTSLLSTVKCYFRDLFDRRGHNRLQCGETLLKRIAVAVALVLVLAASDADAARWGLANVGDAWALFLNGDEPWLSNSAKLNGQFDSVDVSFTTSNPYTLVKTNSGLFQGMTPRAAGDQSTFINRRLDQDPLDGGLGWKMIRSPITANGFAFVAGPLGGTIDTRVGREDGWLFLANLLFSPPVDAEALRRAGSVKVQLYRADHKVAELFPTLADDIIIPLPEVPEPTGLDVACMGTAGAVAIRRRASAVDARRHQYDRKRGG
jgi:hypothetical protein